MTRRCGCCAWRSRCPVAPPAPLPWPRRRNGCCSTCSAEVMRARGVEIGGWSWEGEVRAVCRCPGFGTAGEHAAAPSPRPSLPGPSAARFTLDSLCTPPTLRCRRHDGAAAQSRPPDGAPRAEDRVRAVFRHCQGLRGPGSTAAELRALVPRAAGAAGAGTQGCCAGVWLSCPGKQACCPGQEGRAQPLLRHVGRVVAWARGRPIHTPPSSPPPMYNAPGWELGPFAAGPGRDAAKGRFAAGRGLLQRAPGSRRWHGGRDWPARVSAKGEAE